jgi:DNA topoisomerase I, bacterial
MGEKTNLVIVESPAKAKTIEKFLGKGYTVKSSFGHIRDLSKKDLGIDVADGFRPEYEISADKMKLVSDLKAEASKADTVWLASDEDREGEAIAWHLFETLGLSEDNTKRIAFHEITKSAILEAIDNPRSIDMNLVMAQQARRVLDRLVGFELSPVLWKKVQPKLSAGRVQSVAVRLIVDKEREIMNFKAQQFFKVEAIFSAGGRSKLHATLDKRFNTEAEAREFLEKCKNATFTISSIEQKEGVKSPAAPFTTSVLQQEASRKLGFSVSQTMSIAQRLYEAGIITYMRTDSTNLSSLAINTAKKCIIENYGEEYSKVRNYRTRSKGAQEAHEAIRPTYIENTSIEGASAEKRLYNLIWKRTVASQMADAKIEKTEISISGSTFTEKFIAQGERVLFDGFLKVYAEGRDDEEENGSTSNLPKLENGQTVSPSEIKASEKYTQKPLRYTEGSLVKKLEELGIGRPSTYAPTITTIKTRGYIVEGDKEGIEKQCVEMTLAGGQISSTIKKENYGGEKRKLFPENIGMVVTDFLTEHFSDILDYGFTANVEEDFDDIAAGNKVWNETIGEFYGPFHEKIEKITKKPIMEEPTLSSDKRFIGNDPATGKPIYARIGRFGPLVQRGENDDPEKQFVSLKKGQLIESLTIEDALQLLSLPRVVGSFNGQEITAAIGKFGPYVKFGKTFVSLGKKYDPYNVTEEEAVALIEDHLKKEGEKFIAEFKTSDIQILNGRYGAYIKQGKDNYRIPKGTDPKSINEETALSIIEKEKAKKKK